jgi:acyl-CoA thioester hydrolase
MKEPIEVFKTRVAFGQCDPNGHLNTAQYTSLFDRATWLFLEHLGVMDGYGPDATMGWAEVRVTTEYKHELRVGNEVRLLSSLPKVGRTSVTVRHEMRRLSDDVLCATYEGVTVRFDLLKRAPAPVPEQMRSHAR